MSETSVLFCFFLMENHPKAVGAFSMLIGEVLAGCVAPQTEPFQPVLQALFQDELSISRLQLQAECGVGLHVRLRRVSKHISQTGV